MMNLHAEAILPKPLKRVGIGFGIAALVGIPLGFIIGRFDFMRRMLDPNHDTRPEKIQAALEVLGKRIVMAYDDAA